MECPVCLEYYNITSNIAIKLSCFHILCQLCLKKIQKNNNIICPLCSIKTFDIDDLDKCFTIEEILFATENNIIEKTEELSTKVSISIRNIKGNDLKFTLKRTDTVLKVKEMIKEVEGLPVNTQWLLFDGKLLRNHYTLENLEIRNFDIVYLVDRSCRR